MSKRTFKDWMLESDLKVLESIPEDFEFSMARGELKTIKRSAERIMKHLDGEGDLEAWVQSKITKANDYLNSVANHMDGGEDDTEKKKEVKEGKKSKCDCDCGQDPCVKCGESHHDIKEEKDSKEAKKCPDGKYWCMTDKKCKKIPKGWHMMRSGLIMKDKEHEEEEEGKKNGNGNGEGSESNGGGVSEGWSAKYKKSIDCDNPKGFSQRAHCQGKKKVEESCGSEHSSKKKKKKLSEMISTSMSGKRYRNVDNRDDQEQIEKENRKKKEAKAEEGKKRKAELADLRVTKGIRFYDKKGSGYIRDGKKVYDESVNLDEKCWKGYEKKGMKTMFGKRYPNCVKKEEYSDWRSELEEANKSGDSSLRDWFTKSRASDGTPGWVQLGGKYAGKPCAKQPGQTTKPKCGSSKMKADLSDKEEERAFRRKNRQDPNPDRKGKAKMVATEEKMQEAAGEKDACYKKVKSRYSVWPSAYASGALVKCRKVGASNWGNKTKKEGYEFSNWRDEFKTTEYEFTDLIKSEPIKEAPSFEIGGGHKKAQKMGKIRNLSKGATGGEKDAAQAALKRLGGGISLPLADAVIHPGQLKTEDYQKLQKTGNVFSIMLMWRGKTYRLQLFFSGPKRPSREEVKSEIQKFYPGGVLTHYYPSPSDPTQPIVVIQR